MCACVCGILRVAPVFLPGISGLSLSLSQSRISEQEEQECDWLDSIAHEGQRPLCSIVREYLSIV